MDYFMKTLLNAVLLSLFLLLPFQTVAAGDDLTEKDKTAHVYKMYDNYKNDFPTVKDIYPDKALELLNEDRVVFVDVREEKEIEVSSLPNTVSRGEFMGNQDAYQKFTIVTYCTVGYRSGKFAEEMEQKGISVYNLAGGILAWVLEGGKVYKNGAETNRVHVYGKEWDYLPREYESVKFGLFDRLF